MTKNINSGTTTMSRFCQARYFTIYSAHYVTAIGMEVKLLISRDVLEAHPLLDYKFKHEGNKGNYNIHLNNCLKI